MIKRKFTLSELAEKLNVEFKGDGNKSIECVSSLDHAGPESLSFLSSSKFSKYLKNTQAGAIIISPNHEGEFAGNALIHKQPHLIFAKATHLFQNNIEHKEGIHLSAVVAESAQISSSASIGPNVVIEADVVIEENVVIRPGVFIDKNTKIGKNTFINSNVSVYHNTIIGKNCTIHSNAVLGSDGFGFARDSDNWVKILHFGRAIIGDNVDIGANTTIDRGALDDTIIEDNVILDNQIQIAHNVKIGKNTAIAANVGVAGSTQIGKNCMIGGGSGINGHLIIADGVKVSGMGVITSSILEENSYWSPGVFKSMSMLSWKRNISRLANFNSLYYRIASLEKKITNLFKEKRKSD